MDLKTYALSHGIPIAKDDTLDLLKSLIVTNEYHNILELGTAIGYSAIYMASINPQIHIDTIERNKDRYNQAIANIKKAQMAEQISVYNLNILDFYLWHDYDLIFVDAGKAHYKEYLDWSIDYLAPWGTMVFDNIAFHGLVANKSLTHNRHTLHLVRKLDEFLTYVEKDERFDIMLYNEIGDGVLWGRKRKTEE